MFTDTLLVFEQITMSKSKYADVILDLRMIVIITDTIYKIKTENPLVRTLFMV